VLKEEPMLATYLVAVLAVTLAGLSALTLITVARHLDSYGPRIEPSQDAAEAGPEYLLSRVAP
jgi:hypothetical protein